MHSGLILPASVGRGQSAAADREARRDPDPPESAVRELQRENPRWFLAFGHLPTPHWNVCERWRENDPRRVRIRSGEIAATADFDVICYAPPDIRANDVVGYVRQRLVRVTDAAKQAEKEIAATDAINAAVRQSRLTHARVELEHELSHMSSHDRLLAADATTAHPMVPGATLVDNT